MQYPSFLLVHGSWHGPWCWDKLVPELAALGIKARTVALPSCGTDAAQLGTVADDASAIETALAAIPGDTVVVAHSYGGVPTTQANLPPSVRHVVFLGAFMPQEGQSLVDLLPPGPLPAFVKDNGDGSTSVRPDLAIATFYASCAPETAAWAADRLRLHKAANNVTPVSRCSWRDRSSTYILLTEDFACPTPSQRLMVKQATESAELGGDHSPFLAQPERLAAMLADIVRRAFPAI